MEKHKFKVGDRVKVKKDIVTLNRRTVGKCGTVKELLTDNYCSVEFDEFVGGHDCNGFAKEGHGWNHAEDALDLVKTQNETIVIYRKDNKVIALDKSTGEKAEAKCNPADEFDFRTGAKLAFNRLMGEDVKLDNGVREVKRKAKVGEYVKVVNEKSVFNTYKNEEIFKVTYVTKSGCICKNSEKQCCLWHEEYVVLENYKPKKEPEKKDEICVGDTVKVTDTGNQYNLYGTWSGLLGYEQNFVIDSDVSKDDEYKVLRIKKHDYMSKRTLALIQNPKTTQVFIINIDGIKKVER
jgi:hypothetical protein